jgi:hypothetical protein
VGDASRYGNRVADKTIFTQFESFWSREKKLARLASRQRVTYTWAMTIRDDFFNVEVPEQAIRGMGRIIDEAKVFGLREWFDSLDVEFVTDLIASWETWKAHQMPSCPEETAVPEAPEETEAPLPPPPILAEQCAPTNGKRLRVKFRAPRFRRPAV